MLHQRDAWNGENSIPRTPDSGLASSVADSKYSEGGATGWARTDGLNGSSSKGSHSTGSNEDVYDETLAQPQNTTRYTVIIHRQRNNNLKVKINDEVLFVDNCTRNLSCRHFDWML